MRQDATGPRPALPACLSPPPPSRRSHLQSNHGTTNGAGRSSLHLDDRSSTRSSYDSRSAYHLPIHSGPPPSRSSYSPSTLGSAPVSPYAPPATDTRRGYSNGNSHTIPAPPVSYHSTQHSRAPSYAPSSDYRNGDSSYGSHYYRDDRTRDARNSGPLSYQISHHTYPPMQYGHPPPPPPGGNYPIQHKYQNGYHHGSVSFESDDSGGQAPRRRRGNLPRDTTDLLKQWFAEHLGHPYPTEDEKQLLCRQTGLQMTQVSPDCVSVLGSMV